MNNRNFSPTRFLHISDTHLGPDKDFTQHSVNTYQAFSKVLEGIKNLPYTPDFIIHTGDITADCYDDGYKLMAELIAELKIPMYFVTGNHDTSEQIKKYLPMKHSEVLSNSLNSYRFSCGIHNFLTLDARGSDEIDPHGVITGEQLKILEDEIATGKNLTLFIHYPTLQLDSTWFDENMLLTNADAFHNLLAKHSEQIRGVFFGHIHRSTQSMKDGILYSSVGSTGLQFLLNPDQPEPLFESVGQGFYNLVTLVEAQITIKEVSFGNG